MAFPTYEALAFSHEPTPLAEKLAAEVGRRLAAAIDPRVETSNIADELRDLGYPLTTAGYFADRQVFEVRRPPDALQPGLRLTVNFSTRRAEAALDFPEPDGPTLAARLGTFSRADALQLLRLVRAPGVDVAALGTLLSAYRIALRGLQLDLRLGVSGVRGWLALNGADLDLTTRPATLFAEADFTHSGDAGHLYAALLRFAHQVGLPDPSFVFDALVGGTLESRVEAVGHALGGRLQRLMYGEPDRADTRVSGTLASALFSTQDGASVEVLLLSVFDIDAALISLQHLAEHHKVRLHAGASIRLPAPPHHGAPAPS